MKREQIEEKYKWRLEDIIDGDAEWEKLYMEMYKKFGCVAAYKGKLSLASALYECLDTQDKWNMGIERLYVYSKMRQDEDGSNTKYQAMCDRAESLMIKASAEGAFIMSELTALPTERLVELSTMPLLSNYSYFLREIARSKEHILQEAEEKLLAEARSFSNSFSDIFNMLNDVDLDFGEIEHKGEKVRLTQGTYGVIMHGDDRELRKKAFERMAETYKKNINTIAATYSGSVKKDVFFAKIRKYKSSLEAALDGEDIPPIVYLNLLESINNSLPALHEYMNVRRKALGLDTLHMYDIYVPIVAGTDIKIPFEEACKVVKEGLAPLGTQYGELLDRAFSERWIDVFENEGKRSGAYSWGAYGAHPYVLLNYHETTHEIFTIAHELGHAMHTYYSSQAQAHAQADYQIFVAEIASTVNEVLLLKHLLKTTSNPDVKRYLLSYYLDMFRTTVYRQTMFAEFEKFAHDTVEQGAPLTHEVLSDEYYKLNKKYYGLGIDSDDLIRYEWAKVPHFYRDFYVYKYATGMISAVCIAEKIIKEGQPAVDAYKKFLSAGGSMSPLDTLKLAGIDLVKKDAFDTAFKAFASTLDELKKV